MKILAFDSSQDLVSVALLHDGMVTQIIVPEKNKHAELLVPTIESILRDARIWYGDLDFIATTSGPGSFTGVRVGLSCARAIVLAVDAPLFTFDNLAVFAYKNRHNQGKILVALSAGVGEFFIAEFLCDQEILTRLTESRFVGSDEFAQISKNHDFICGNAVNREEKISANLLCEMVQSKVLVDKNSGAANYLRQASITKRKNVNLG